MNSIFVRTMELFRFISPLLKMVTHFVVTLKCTAWNQMHVQCFLCRGLNTIRNGGTSGGTSGVENPVNICYITGTTSPVLLFLDLLITDPELTVYICRFYKSLGPIVGGYGHSASTLGERLKVTSGDNLINSI